MHVLWERGPSSVQEVQQLLEGTPAYTTVQTIMTTMEKKGPYRKDTARQGLCLPCGGRARKGTRSCGEGYGSIAMMLVIPSSVLAVVLIIMAAFGTRNST